MLPAPSVNKISPSFNTPFKVEANSSIFSTKTGSTWPRARIALAKLLQSAPEMTASPAENTSNKTNASTEVSTAVKSSNKSRVRV